MADTTSLHLRLPKSLYKKLQRQARRNNVSLNTQIVNQLSNPKDLGIAPILRKEIEKEIELRIPFIVQKETGGLGFAQKEIHLGLAPVLRKEIEKEIEPRIATFLQEKVEPILGDIFRGWQAKIETLRGLPEPVPYVLATDLEAAKTRIVALENEVAHLRGQAESERKVQDMRAVPERQKGEEQK